MLRVLHVIGIMNHGGAESMIMNYYRNVNRELIQFDFVENTDATGEYDSEIIKLGGKIFRCPRYNGLNHFLYLKWWEEFFIKHKNEYCVVHGHLGSTAALYLKVAKSNGIFVIAHSHSVKISLMYSLYSYPTRYIADYFLACDKRAGIKRYGEKIVLKSNRYATLTNAISIDDFIFSEVKREKVRNKYNINENLVVGTVGRLVKVKNPDGIISIVKELYKHNKNIKFLWVGDGVMKEYIQKKLIKNNIEDIVIMTGDCSEVNNILQAMDVFILPSISEGFSIAALEAQISGLRCILSDKIPRSVNVTGNCSFLPINKSKLWAKEILSKDNSRLIVDDSLENSVFNVKIASKWLENFYFQHVTK